LFYVLIAGARAPVLRAGIFASLYYLGISLQRYRDHWNILGMTALVLLLIDPGNLFDPGFQLSFSAVAGILFLTSVLLPEILKIKGTPKPLSIKLDWKEVSFRTIAYLRIPDISIKWDWKKNCLYYIAGYRAPPFAIRSFLKKVFSLFVMSAGAFFGTSLVMAYHFHNLVPGTVIVNMLVVPLATLVVGLGLSELVVGPVIPLFGSYFGGSTEGLIQLIFRINRYAGEFPLMSFWVGHREVVYVLFSVLFVFIVWALSLKAVRHKKKFCIATALLFVVWGYWLSGPEDVMRVVFLDVGQGDSALLSFPDGSNWLVDGGNDRNGYDAGERHVLPYLQWAGIRYLDGIILTHPNSDHYGGLASVLQNVGAGTLYEPVDSKLFIPPGRFVQALDERAVDRTIKRQGDRIGSGSVAGNSGEEKFQDTAWRIYVVSPRIDLESGERSDDTNDISLVLLLQYGETKMLMTGDISAEQEQRLVDRYGDFLDSGILKVSHHGSRFSSGDEFLKAVTLDFAVISSGKYNSYGHPAPETVERLRSA
jgi:competence protein ComEC